MSATRVRLAEHQQQLSLRLHRIGVSPRALLYAVVALVGTWFLYSTFGFYTTPTDRAGWKLPNHNDERLLLPPAPPTWDGKAQRVREAFLHAYHGWEDHAAPADELLPLSEGRVNNFNGWGVTMFDALDTMQLMGLDAELARALPRVEAATFQLKKNAFAPFFETTIRYLGGLLSAHALATEPRARDAYLAAADRLGGLLAPAFRTTSGFPVFAVDTNTGQGKGNILGSLAEVASCQLEYAYLAKATGKREYFVLADTVVKNLASANLSTTAGMLPNHVNITSAEPFGNHLSIGAAADSTHEYLLKYYLMTGRTDKASLEMYLQMTTAVIAHLLYLSPTRGLLYVTDVKNPGREPSHMYEHLSSFAAGLFALGASTLPLDDLPSVGIDYLALSAHLPAATQHAYRALSRFGLKAAHEAVARGLAQTAWATYADSASGLGPDEVTFLARVAHEGRPTGERARPWLPALEAWVTAGRAGAPPGCGDPEPRVYTDADRVEGPAPGHARDYKMKAPAYLLRPETVEAFFVLWRTTREPVWRERGWAVFEALERAARTRVGFASLSYADAALPPRKDDMPSFFLAETLKYLFLLFSDDDLVPLDKWVLNTEAHPLPVFEWTADERARFGIA